MIRYQLSKDSQVRITVYDMLGRQVKALYNGQQVAGNYNVYWNGTSDSGIQLPSGGYIIQMKTDKTGQIQKVLLIR